MKPWHEAMRTHQPTSESCQLQPKLVPPGEGGWAAAAHVAEQPGAGQHLQR